MNTEKSKLNMTEPMDSSQLTQVRRDSTTFLDRIDTLDRTMSSRSRDRLRNKCTVQFAARQPGNDDERMAIYTEVRQKFVESALLPL